MRATADAGRSTDYDALAPHYDAFTSGSDYERWTDGVLEHSRGHALSGRTLLDLACGTGNSFLPFLDRGFEVVGCDSSGAMLAEAARKAPRARLVLADLREVPLLGAFDLVTCFDDSLNYLPAEPDLRAAFASMAANLAPRGLALFDLNSLQAYRTTFAHDSVRESDDGRVFAWRGESSESAQPGCAAGAWIDVFVPAPDGSPARAPPPRAASLPGRSSGGSAPRGGARAGRGERRARRRHARGGRGRAAPPQGSVHRETREGRCCPVTIKKTDKPVLPVLSITKVS